MGWKVGLLLSSAMQKLSDGDSLTQNENMIMVNVLSIAMDRNGVE